jgi:hypothetical protein
LTLLLRKSSLLILIAAALLLSGVRSVSAQGLGPSQSVTQQRNHGPQQTQANAKKSAPPTRVEQSPASVNSISGQSGPEEVSSNSDNNPPELRKVGEWIIASIASMSAQGWSNFVIALATVFLAIFTGQLVCVTRDLHKATEAALHIDRPFLLVTNVQCPAFSSEGSGNEILYIYEFEVCLRNFGVGPADIVDYIAGAAVRDRRVRGVPLLQGIVEPEVAWFAPSGQRLAESLVAPREIANGRIKTRAILSRGHCDAVRNGEKAIGIDGIIRYRGASQQVYWTRFFWWCFLDVSDSPINIQRALRSNLNDHN